MPKFIKGVSGNPRGRPRTQCLVTRDDADAIIAVVVDRAKAGDLSAALSVLDRVWPIPSKSKETNHA